MTKKPSPLESLYEALLKASAPPSPSGPLSLLAPDSFGRTPTALASLADLAPKVTSLRLKEDLETKVKKIFRNAWSARDGEVVPEPEDLQLGNDAVILNATILYADIASSTALVDNYPPKFAAEVYKSYLACAAPIIKKEGGVITAYDGDRIMGVFIGDRKNTSAVSAALKINGAVWDIIKPAMKAQYPLTTYDPRHVVGIDTSKLLVCRIGVRNDNDLVWVGRAANYAAKLSSLSDKFAIYITHSVYNVMNNQVKYGGANNEHMWHPLTCTTMNNLQLYASIWKFPL